MDYITVRGLEKICVKLWIKSQEKNLHKIHMLVKLHRTTSHQTKTSNFFNIREEMNYSFSHNSFRKLFNKFALIIIVSSAYFVHRLFLAVRFINTFVFHGRVPCIVLYISNTKFICLFLTHWFIRKEMKFTLPYTYLQQKGRHFISAVSVIYYESCYNWKKCHENLLIKFSVKILEMDHIFNDLKKLFPSIFVYCKK
jgi:hypothetical protein